MLIVQLLLLAFLVLLGLLALWGLLTYNGFVRARLRCREAWSSVDVQLKRRADLVPNLVETVKGYAGHERTTLEGVIRARSAVLQAQGAAEAAAADSQLMQALGRIFALVESYPQLRASESFLALQKELADIEEKIAYARQFYNRNVLDYNQRTQTFPPSLLAGPFGFAPIAFFEAASLPGEVRVDFGGGRGEAGRA